MFFVLTCFAFSYTADFALAGSNWGLYCINRNSQSLIWSKAEVRKILKVGDTWYMLTAAGIYTTTYTADGRFQFKSLNEGLPVKTIKKFEHGTKSFVSEIQELKDLEVHPENSQIMVTATREAVFLTRNGGRTWQNLGISAVTAGVKAVAVLDLPDESGILQLTVLMSHPIYGISWIRPDDPKPVWTDINDGLERMPTIKWPDEVSDLAAVRIKDVSIELYASQTFMSRIYRLDWKAKKFLLIWSGGNGIDAVDGLSVSNNSIVFTGQDAIREISLRGSVNDGIRVSESRTNSQDNGTTDATAVPDWNRMMVSVPGFLRSMWIPGSLSAGRGDVSLSELWLLHSKMHTGLYTGVADRKKGNYLPAYQVTSDAGFDAHLATLKANNLNMLVVDMKDDSGYIRYDSHDPLVLEKGWTGKGISVESFVEKAKKNGIYLVARIVVFKDKALASYDDGKYAVWDKTEKKPWRGYEVVTRQIQTTANQSPSDSETADNAKSNTVSAEKSVPKTEKVRKYYEEYWVDPYSEEVWEYNIAIAKELVARGFDEIQFDYIRFPTDGANLRNASYRWQEQGMDKESALMSFLSYARQEIRAPISIDIYGANGWYRTGARTGQDVELLARYVDVICPMFYPSHFEQSFLAQSPAQDRPYRIYYYGSWRTTIIARDHVIVRPWAQAFYLNVSYDRKYYNVDYVRHQIEGIRDSVNNGYTYWNNSGRYTDIRPDITEETVSNSQ